LKPLPLQDLQDYIDELKLERVSKLKEMLHEKIITIEQFNVKLELAMNE
jgi:hypothetical protein